MSLDRLAAMAVLVRVVEAGSFSKAADTLSMQKARVTRQVQLLEAELGVRLLQRTTRRLAVTAEGERYYQRAVALLADLEDLESQTRHAAAGISGSLRLETDASLGLSVLAPALPDFQARHPDIAVSLSLGNRTADLISENIDAALRTGSAAQSAAGALSLGEARFVTVASPSYLAAFGHPAHPQDLARMHQTVGLIKSGGRTLDFRFSVGEAAPMSLALPHALLLDDAMAYVEAVAQGLGIGQAPLHAVSRALVEQRVVAILPDHAPPPVPMWLVPNPKRPDNARLLAFMRWATEVFGWPLSSPSAGQVDRPRTTRSNTCVSA